MKTFSIQIGNGRTVAVPRLRGSSSDASNGGDIGNGCCGAGADKPLENELGHLSEMGTPRQTGRQLNGWRWPIGARSPRHRPAIAAPSPGHRRAIARPSPRHRRVIAASSPGRGRSMAAPTWINWSHFNYTGYSVIINHWRH